MTEQQNVEIPTLKKWNWYRHRKNKDGVDVIPTEDTEVTKQTYDQYIEVKRRTNHEA